MEISAASRYFEHTTGICVHYSCRVCHCKQKKLVVAPLLLDKRNKNSGKTYPKGAFLTIFCREFFVGTVTSIAERMVVARDSDVTALEQKGSSPAALKAAGGSFLEEALALTIWFLDF